MFRCGMQSRYCVEEGKPVRGHATAQYNLAEQGVKLSRPEPL